ncbi:Gfo/Idh/MocA family protein [Sporolactobacillus kofuensis]|uniref:Gfo/Idh/MocA family protein n=1 Tax=Sporolactobacillus kofuensis TaxID=269672 RepID=A0ABW1WI60_9BACL|nr:Gfo/Idh/MocA family oxidoreductase [Sporolactobacillus kofuensis]MCO7176608.1 Gfo/Idh/MocA family oxidoreductase [Sporolactobacillus kofuensis]
MLKVGVIGIGSIALKAYLPIYSEIDDVDFYFCTRNQDTINRIRAKYRWAHLYSSLDDLLNETHETLQAAFVHSATASHVPIIERLIKNGIAVYVDKPIADHYDQAEKLTNLAENLKVPLMTGFNRRFAPFYQTAKSISNKTMVICQKNRSNAPGDLRTIVFDDYIHVVDSLRFLVGKPLDIQSVHVVKDQMNRVVALSTVFRSGSILATGIMNRVSGTNQEVTQVMAEEGECIVRNLSELKKLQGTSSCCQQFNDWDRTLYKRGFEGIVHKFLSAVKENKDLPIAKRDALETHRLCEWIVEKGEVDE